HGLVEIEAARARHPHVEQNTAGSVDRRLEKKVPGGAVDSDLVSRGAQEPRDRGSKRGIVVDDVNDRGLLGHVAGSGTGSDSLRVRARGWGDAGRENWNVAPPFKLFSAAIVPPCASTIERQIERPSPTPCFLVVKNDWKSRARSLSEIPWPVSDTRAS